MWSCVDLTWHHLRFNLRNLRGWRMLAWILGLSTLSPAADIRRGFQKADLAAPESFCGIGSWLEPCSSFGCRICSLECPDDLVPYVSRLCVSRTRMGVNSRRVGVMAEADRVLLLAPNDAALRERKWVRLVCSGASADSSSRVASCRSRSQSASSV